MFEKSCCDKIVRHGFPAFADIETEEDNDNYVVYILRQIGEIMIISVFAGIKRFLSSPALFERCFQIFFIINSFQDDLIRQ
jgi:hypothetical protein